LRPDTPFQLTKPCNDGGVTLWFEPTWHLRGPEHVLTGSRQAAHDPDAEDPDAGFNLAAEAIDVLDGRRITDVIIELVTGDLFLSLEGDYLVRTFVSDPTDGELWHIRDNVSRSRRKRSGRDLTIAIEATPHRAS
jgi:hypothetical protein